MLFDFQWGYIPISPSKLKISWIKNNLLQLASELPGLATQYTVEHRLYSLMKQQSTATQHHQKTVHHILLAWEKMQNENLKISTGSISVFTILILKNHNLSYHKSGLVWPSFSTFMAVFHFL